MPDELDIERAKRAETITNTLVDTLNVARIFDDPQLMGIVLGSLLGCIARGTDKPAVFLARTVDVAEGIVRGELLRQPAA